MEKILKYNAILSYLEAVMMSKFMPGSKTVFFKMENPLLKRCIVFALNKVKPYLKAVFEAHFQKLSLIYNFMIMPDYEKLSLKPDFWMLSLLYEAA